MATLKIIHEIKAHMAIKKALITPPVTEMIVPGSSLSDATMNLEEKTKIHKTGQASNKKLQGQNGGSQEDIVPSSHHKIPSELTSLN